MMRKGRRRGGGSGGIDSRGIGGRKEMEKKSGLECLYGRAIFSFLQS